MASGMHYSYSDTVPQKRMVTDRIIMADPMSIVGLLALGLNNESKFMFVNNPGKVYEWLEDTYSPRVDTAVETLSSDSTVTQFVVTNGAYFQIGDVIQVDDEYMWVSAESSNTLTVTRGYGGTQATHANTSSVYIRMRNRLEGADNSDSNWTESSTGYNYSAILHKGIIVSRSDARIPRYGIPNVVDREIDKAMDELMMLLNLGLYHGQRQVGTTTTPRGFGGLKTFLSTNGTALSGTPALTRKNIEDEVQQCWEAGGAPKLLLCNGWAKRKIASFYEGFVRTSIDESRGGITIDKIETPLGITLDVVVDRHCQTDHLYILDTDYVGYITFDDFFEEELGKTGDTAYKGQIIGEYGFVAAFEKASSYISGFSTSA